MTLPSLRPLALVLLVLTCGTALGFAAPAEGKKGKGKGGAPAGSVDNVAAANAHLRRQYRPGWRVAGL